MRRTLLLILLAYNACWAQNVFPPPAGGGGATPTGPSGSVQFNNAGALGGSNGLLFDPSSFSLAAQVPDVIPTAVSNTTGGGTFYEYFVIANFAGGLSTGAPQNGNSPDYAYVEDGPTTLDSTHYNDISWTNVAGAVSYDIWTDDREGTVNSFGKLGTVAAGTLTFRDNGVAGDGTFTSVQNTAGSLTTSALNAIKLTVDSCVGCGVLINDLQQGIFIGNGIGPTNPSYQMFGSIAIGKYSLINARNTGGGVNGFENLAIGAAALEGTTIGHDNIAIGIDTLYQLIDGTYNTVVGERAMQDVQHGDANAVLGEEAGAALNPASGSADQNVFVGAESWHTQTTGSQNTVVGTYAGLNASGNLNVFLGYKAGYNETGSNKLYIANSETTTPLIGGDFSAATLFINGRAGATLHTPTSSSEACTAGQFSDDASFHYVCVSAGVWKRVALSSF